MNKYDGLLIESILDSAGHEKVDQARTADIVIINTCSVRDHAEKRAKANIRMLADHRKRVAVCGCMAQHRARDLLAELGVDYIIGPDNYQLLPGIIKTDGPVVATDLDGEDYSSVIPDHRGVSAMVTVMRGCDNYCSYCVVPYVRGRVRSRSLRSIINEVQKAASKGVKDVLLLGQDITAYNDSGADLARLLEEVSMIPDLKRIRFLTSHPGGVTRTLIENMARNDKVCSHFHLPLQSGSNRILELMKRGYSIEYYMDLIGEIRERIPDVSITTDLIVGFPTETEDDYQATIRAVEKIRFDFAYMFRYSERRGTKAMDLEPKVLEGEIGTRLKDLIRIQNRITKENNRSLIGKGFEVLIERKGRRGDFLGRTRQNIMVAVGGEVKIGKFYDVKITKIKGWTPVGEVSA